MNDIIGIYTGVPKEAWYPDMIQVNLSNSEIDGDYNKIDAGGGGVIFQRIISSSFPSFDYLK